MTKLHLRISRPIVVTLSLSLSLCVSVCVCVFSPTSLAALDKLNKTSIRYCFCISSISHGRCCARQPCILAKRSVLFGPQCYQYINRVKRRYEDLRPWGGTSYVPECYINFWLPGSTGQAAVSKSIVWWGYTHINIYLRIFLPFIVNFE